MVEVEESKITFDDVGGMEDIKKKINMDFIMPIKNPEYFQAFGKKVGGSLLFYNRLDVVRHFSASSCR